MAIRRQSVWILVPFLLIVIVASPFVISPSKGLAHRPLSSHRPSIFKTWTMKSNATSDGPGQSRSAASDVVESVLELDMDEYCSVLDDFGCVAFEESGPEEKEEDKEDDTCTKPRLIRVQGDADECLHDVNSQDDVRRKIREVRESQSNYGRADLYERRWRSKSPVERIVHPFPINGEFEVNGKSTDDVDRSFTVAQFNTLAEGLSSGPSIKTPFPCESMTDTNSEKNCFGGFTAIKNPEIALDFDLRRWRLMETILDSSCDFDIIALEEVDRYRGFFAPVLKLFGYQGIFVPKLRSPGVQLGWYSDGCALFFKEDLFELVAERRLNYRVGNQVYILATLRHRQSGQLLIVAVTHLKARKSVDNEHLRSAQVAELLEKVGQERQKIRAGSEDVPTLILGDFNAEPPSDESGESCVRLVLDHHKLRGSSQFHSAYPVDPSPPSFFTTWKTRGSETVKRVIDYIFYSNLTCTGTLEIPDSSEVEADQCPGFRSPSDHLMIASKFCLPNE